MFDDEYVDNDFLEDGIYYRFDVLFRLWWLP